MQRKQALFFALLVGAASIAGPALAATAYSPTGHLNVLGTGDAWRLILSAASVNKARGQCR